MTPPLISYLPRATLHALMRPALGLNADPSGHCLRGIAAALCWGERSELEGDARHKQIIPYVVLRAAGGDVWTMQRGHTQSETRLHGRRSVGVGGHLEQKDAHGSRGDGGAIVSGLYRELFEEIEVTSAQLSAPRYLGLLDDERDEVGQVHLGVVFEIVVHSGPIAIRERDRMTGTWVGMKALQSMADSLESWSTLLLPHLSGP